MQDRYDAERPGLARRPSLRISGSFNRWQWSHAVSEDSLIARLPPMGVSTGPKIMSKLFHATLGLWSTILDLESDQFSPSPGKSAGSAATLEDGQSLAGPGAPEMLLGHTLCEERCWKMKSCLSEERDRLCLWKSSFTDEDLDQLLESQSSLYSGLANSVLEALLSIAILILDSTSKYPSILQPHVLQVCRPVSPVLIIPGSLTMDVTSCPGSTSQKLREESQKLNQLVKEGRSIIGGDLCQNGMEQNEMPTAQMINSVLIERLQAEIWRVQRLSFQIKLVFYEIDSEVSVTPLDLIGGSQILIVSHCLEILCSSPGSVIL